MAGYTQLDLAGCSAADNALILISKLATLALFLRLPFCLCVLLACAPTSAYAQTASSDLQQWVASGQWQLIVDQIGPLQHRTAEMEFNYGTALAHLRHLPEAAAAFRAGERLAPRDARFPTELAGIAFEQKRYPIAARQLRRALRLAPEDAY